MVRRCRRRHGRVTVVLVVRRVDRVCVWARVGLVNRGNALPFLKADRSEDVCNNDLFVVSEVLQCRLDVQGTFGRILAVCRRQAFAVSFRSAKIRRDW